MNKVILMGRLTRDPEVRYSAGDNSMAIARYTLAVDRRFAEKYFRQGLKVVVSGRIQTGSYTNRDGQKVYTTDVVVEDQEFAESKAASDNYRGGNFGGQAAPSAPTAGGSGSADGFMNIPDGIDEDLPFN